MGAVDPAVESLPGDPRGGQRPGVVRSGTVPRIVARGPREDGNAIHSPRLFLLLGWLLLASACWIPRWPVPGQLTSPFGVRSEGWSLGIHRGVDIAVPLGTQVRAMAPGRVRFAGTMTGYGQVVWLDHAHGLMTVYAHLSQIGVDRGQTVEGRSVVGRSGRSGNATGDHLHFEVWRRGREVDPVPFLGGYPGGRGTR